MPTLTEYDNDTEEDKPVVGGPNDGKGSLSDDEQKSFDNIAEREEGFASESSEINNENDDVDLFRPDKSNNQSPISQFRTFFSRNRKGFLGGGITAAVVALVIGGGSFIIPHELVHIKETVAQNLGGIQDDIAGNRRMRILGRAYFFNNGEFDGYKSKGKLFSFLENRSSDKLVKELRSKGYTIDPQVDGSGRWTGRFTSITGPDGVPINDSDSLWSRRSALRTTINDIYPERSLVWRNFKTADMYRRYGLTRGNWWTDNAATRKLNSAEERFKQKVRDAIKNKTGATITTPAEAPVNKDGETNPSEVKEVTELNSSTQDAISQEEDALKNNTSTSPLNGDPLGEANSVKAVGGSLLNVIKITGIADDGCQVVGTANMIQKTARTAKALQLASNASRILSLADAIKTGKADSKTINDAMVMINGLDPDTKKNFFGSGGWLSISTKKTVKSTYGTTYNAGGGFNGAIKTALDQVYNILGGKQGVNDKCKTLSNPFVQVGSLVTGIAATIFSGGSFNAVNIAGHAVLEVGKQLIIQFGAQLAIKTAVGTVVDGSEKGERLGDSFMSGAGTMFAMNGSSIGMKPLTNQEYAFQQSEYNNLVQSQIAQEPIFKQLISTDNPNSLANKYMDGVASIQNSGILTFIAKLPTQFTNLFSKSALADEPSDCNDEDIVNAHIKTDNFCNPMYGNTDTELDKIDPMDNILWMYNHGKVDGDGNAQDDYATYIEACFENPEVNTLYDSGGDYASIFTTECFDAGDPTENGIGLHERFRAFRLDSTILECLNQYLDDGFCGDDTSQADGQTVATDNPGTVTISSDGFAFPLETSKSVIEKGVNGAHWAYNCVADTSPTRCHHDYRASDIMAPTGTPVVAARGGEVTVVHRRLANSTVTIKGDDGNLYFYAHNGTIKVDQGDTVTAGQQIATVGTSTDTGNGSPPHLHFDILPAGGEWGNGHPECGGPQCSQYPFIDPQPALIKAFEQML